MSEELSKQQQSLETYWTVDRNHIISDISQYCPETYAAVLIINQYSPDEYYISTDMCIYRTESDTLIHGDPEVIKAQLDATKSFNSEMLKAYNEVTVAINEVAVAIDYDLIKIRKYQELLLE